MWGKDIVVEKNNNDTKLFFVVCLLIWPLIYMLLLDKPATNGTDDKLDQPSLTKADLNNNNKTILK